jgi:hypothetical protein
VSAEQAKKDAEALRYRLIVRLALITREATEQGRTDVAAAATALRKELEALAIEDAPDKATETLLMAQPKLAALQRELGLPDHGVAVYPKWLRFAAWTSPAVVGMGVIAWIIERRRKKRTLSEADIQRLEQTTP